MSHAPILVPVFVLCSGLAGAADILVGPGQSIQAAIDAASSGDRILVQPGVYLEAIDYKAKHLEIIGVDGPEATTIDAAGLGTSAVTVTGAAPSTTVSLLDGFTVTHGSAAKGGGILVGGSGFQSAVTVRVTRCIIRDNSAVVGGGVASVDGQLELVDCAVEHNVATGKGGGLFLGVNLPFEVHDCRIAGNTAADGGGIATDSHYGPITRCEIRDNVATSRGGGIACFARVFSLNASRVEGNRAVKGGGLYWIFPSLASPADFCVTSTIVRANQASVSGGAVHAETGANDGFFVLSQVSISNCTIAVNRAPAFGAVELIKHPQVGHPAQLLLRSSIVWDNGPNPLPPPSPSHVATSCDIEGGYAGTGNISLDPKFVAPESGDLHLRFGSPCIELGFAATCWQGPSTTGDVEGDPFVGTADIGADEFHRRVYVTGSPEPSGEATLHCIGFPGEPVLLLMSTGLAAAPLPVAPYGDLLLALPFLPGSPIALRPIDPEGTLAFPFLVPHSAGGSTLAVQCLIGSHLSNAESFEL